MTWASSLSTTVFIASLRSSLASCWPRRTAMLAPGAMACTASTSRVSSPYQPAASHSSTNEYVAGRDWVNW